MRRVLEYMEWITEEPIIEEISDDVTINIRMAQQKHKEKKLLTLKVFDKGREGVPCVGPVPKRDR